MSHDTLRRPFLSTRHPSKTRFFGLWRLSWLVLALAQPALADDADLPHLCSDDTTQLRSNPSNPADCYEFGAAVGELGWNWRKKLPSHVRWVVRKDAPALCGQAQTEFGQKVDSPVPGGCVFLTPTTCTIVSTGPISSASIGNAVRDCVP